MVLRRISRPILVAAVAAACTTGLRADTVTLFPEKDNTMFNNGNSNALGDLFCGRTGSFGGNTVQRLLVDFDVAGAIPAGSTINSATLTLTLLLAGPAAVNDAHRIYRVLADWGEGTSYSPAGNGADPTAGDATWFHTFYPNEFWTAAGGDYSATSSATLLVGNASGASFTWGPTAQMTADVQYWLDNPGSNFGWIMRANEVQTLTARKFGSRENIDIPFRPMLDIDFTPPVVQCAGDVNEDGSVNPQDLALLLGAWGPNPEHPADLNDDGVVNPQDLALLLGNWGECP